MYVLQCYDWMLCTSRSTMHVLQAGLSAQPPGAADPASQGLPLLPSQASPADQAALVTWESFKSLAKPGDRLRLLGDGLSLPEDVTNAVEGVMVPVGSGMPLVTDSDVAAWGSNMQAGDSAGPTVTPVDETAMTANDGIAAGDGATSFGVDADADGDGQKAWGLTLEVAGSQAEKLLVLAEVGLHLTMWSRQCIFTNLNLHDDAACHETIRGP